MATIHLVEGPIGLVEAVDREEFYGRADAMGFDLSVYLLEPPEEVRRQRARERNIQQGATYQMEVSEDIFTLANNAWQAPDETECRDRDIQRIS